MPKFLVADYTASRRIVNPAVASLLASSQSPCYRVRQRRYPMGLLGLIILALDIVAIVDCAKSNADTGKKVLWIVLILLLPLLGMILYFLLGRK
jgi:hypothetical protein